MGPCERNIESKGQNQHKGCKHRLIHAGVLLKHEWQTQSKNLPMEHACNGSIFVWDTLLLHNKGLNLWNRIVVKKIFVPKTCVPRGGWVIKKEIKLNYVWIILKLPYPSIGQCPIEYPTPHINQNRYQILVNFTDFGRWGGLPTPPPLGVV